MQSGKGRAGVGGKGASGELLDSARDAKAMQFAGEERFQDKEIECALQKRGLFGLHRVLLSAVYTGPRIECQYERLSFAEEGCGVGVQDAADGTGDGKRAGE